MESQRAVRRHAQEGKQLSRAWKRGAPTESIHQWGYSHCYGLNVERKQNVQRKKRKT